MATPNLGNNHTHLVNNFTIAKITVAFAQRLFWVLDNSYKNSTYQLILELGILFWVHPVTFGYIQTPVTLLGIPGIL